MASLGNVFILPGFQGTHLEVLPLFGPRVRLWVSYPPVLAGLFGFLQLEADGLTPVTGVLGDILPNGLIAEYYNPIGARLVADGWTPFEIGWDWRKSLMVMGNLLYDKIVATIGTQDYYLVGHSAGGLLARMCYRRAVQLNTQARIKRIVSIGCPHWGTYAALQTFSGLHPIYRTLSLATSATDILTGRGGHFPGVRSDLLDRVGGSWPLLYELLPQTHEPNITDPDRPLIYSKTNWPTNFPRVTQDRLNSADDTHLALRSLIPPDALLVDVCGRGVSTPSALFLGMANIASTIGYRQFDGDGTVTRNAAQLGPRAAEVFSLHADLVRHPSVLNNLTRWLRDGLPAIPPIEQIVGGFGDLGPDGLPGPLVIPSIDRTTIELFDPGRFPSSDTQESRPAYCP